MIEVEKKFRLNPEQEAKLIEGAVSLGEITNVDVYYDKNDYSLTKKSHWLRNRNGRFELKKRLHDLSPRNGATIYDEIEDEKRIASFLEINYLGDLNTDLKTAGYQPIANYKVQRRSYKNGKFHIDLDSCDFNYSIAEIELLVDDESQKQKALDDIINFADLLGIDPTPVRGKLVEYLHRFSPDHFKALVDAGVVRL